MTIELEPNAPMRAYQRYIHQLEKLHGWLTVDLVHNCFLMGEEVGELFKAIRRFERYYDEATPAVDPNDNTRLDRETRRAAVAEELVDVLNYLLALANRLEIDLEQAFRDKNARNQTRTWTD